MSVGASGPMTRIAVRPSVMSVAVTKNQSGIVALNAKFLIERNNKANAEAFTAGWFRTGDQGQMDEAGYLTLTGRLKEIINRGGEKISPREVDDILMTHPAVAQAVVFAMPHDKLGEEIAAAIVLRDGEEASEREHYESEE